MHIELAYTHPATKAVNPHAVLVIESIRVEISKTGRSVQLGVALYATLAAMDAGAEPIERRTPMPLGDAQISALQDDFSPAVYAQLLDRPEFASGQIVDPS